MSKTLTLPELKRILKLLHLAGEVSDVVIEELKECDDDRVPEADDTDCGTPGMAG
jgi:hypothetical protein